MHVERGICVCSVRRYVRCVCVCVGVWGEECLCL